MCCVFGPSVSYYSSVLRMSRVRGSLFFLTLFPWPGPQPRRFRGLLVSIDKIALLVRHSLLSSFTYSLSPATGRIGAAVESCPLFLAAGWAKIGVSQSAEPGEAVTSKPVLTSTATEETLAAQFHEAKYRLSPRRAYPGFHQLSTRSM